MTRLRLCLVSLSFALFTGSATAEVAAPPVDDPIVEPAPAPQVVDRAALRTALEKRRLQTLKHFLAYRDARVYPINDLPGGGKRHVWIDRRGNLCAAATLISKDWGRDAAIRVGKHNLEIKLADVKSGPVADWMATSGMTRAELVAIQLPGDFVLDRRPQETNRMHQIYVDVERQIRSLWDHNLDLATDELMKQPVLAKLVLAGGVAGPGEFGRPEPKPASTPRFAKPPVG